MKRWIETLGNSRLLICLCLLALFLAFDCAHAQGDVIGNVVAVEGSVIATKGSQLRPLEVGSPIYLRDVIEVDVDARAQIKLTDGSLINLIPDSEYRVDTYRHNALFRSNRCVSSLAKGGLRLLSGSIGDTDPENYQIKTPAATIGLRGTLLDATLLGGSLFVTVIKGAVDVLNQEGIITVQAGQTASTLRTIAPNILPSRPPPLNPRLFVPPPGGHLHGTNMNAPDQDLLLEESAIAEAAP